MDIDTNLKYVQKARETFNLSPAEVVMVTVINAGLLGDKATLKTRLIGDLQAAIEVELATIPLYLYSYYSINRTKLQGSDLDPAQIFANEAGGVIMSVAVEEMLHMSLSSNIFFSLTGEPPKLYQAAPGSYPALLPHHNPVVPEGPDPQVKGGIPLRPFCSEQMWHFLQIEYPHNPFFSDLSVEALPELLRDLSHWSPDEAKAFLNEHGWPQIRIGIQLGSFIPLSAASLPQPFLTMATFRQATPSSKFNPIIMLPTISTPSTPNRPLILQNQRLLPQVADRVVRPGCLGRQR